MTKKDFELIARIIKTLGQDIDDFPTAFVAGQFAKALAGSNPRFDSARFVAACTAE